MCVAWKFATTSLWIICGLMFAANVNTVDTGVTATPFLSNPLSVTVTDPACVLAGVTTRWTSCTVITRVRDSTSGCDCQVYVSESTSGVAVYHIGDAEAAILWGNK